MTKSHFAEGTKRHWVEMRALCNKRVTFNIRQNSVWRLGMKKVVVVVIVIEVIHVAVIILSLTDCSGNQRSFIDDYIFACTIIIVIACI